MERILVMGPSGSGKSTLARQLGALLDLPVVHLDQLFWRPGWVESPPAEFYAAVVEALNRSDRWVIDGNYRQGAIEARLAACDTIVCLDVPRRVCLWRVLRRIARSYGRVRPDLAEGCPEKLDWEFLRWVWDTPKRRPALMALVESQRATRQVFVLTGSREVRAFLAAVRGSRVDSPQPARP